MAETPGKPTPPPPGSELLRENVFDGGEAVADDDELLRRRQPTMLRCGRKLIAPSTGQAKKRYTVVFDLDETVVYARDGPLYARAYLKDLLRALKDDFEVIVWTAGERDYAKSVLEEINEDHIIQHLIYRHRRWFKSEDYTKDLKRLGRDLDYTIIVENTPDCVRANPQNGIIVDDFEVPQDEDDTTPSQPTESPPTVEGNGGDCAPATPDASAKHVANDVNSTVLGTTSALPSPPVDGGESVGGDGAVGVAGARGRRRARDRTLILLREVLLALVQGGDTVPHFLAQCKLLSRQTVLASDGAEIPIYHLGPRRRRKDAGSPKKVVKENRDKVAAVGTETKRPRCEPDDAPPVTSTTSTSEASLAQASHVEISGDAEGGVQEAVKRARAEQA